VKPFLKMTPFQQGIYINSFASLLCSSGWILSIFGESSREMALLCWGLFHSLACHLALALKAGYPQQCLNSIL